MTPAFCFQLMLIYMALLYEWPLYLYGQCNHSPVNRIENNSHTMQFIMVRLQINYYFLEDENRARLKS